MVAVHRRNRMLSGFGTSDAPIAVVVIKRERVFAFEGLGGFRCLRRVCVWAWSRRRRAEIELGISMGLSHQLSRFPSFDRPVRSPSR